MRFTPCEHCKRHVRMSATTCPFCNTARTPQSEAPRAAIARTGRVLMVSVGLGMGGCAASVDPSRAGDSATTTDAVFPGDIPQTPDARVDAGRDVSDAGRDDVVDEEIQLGLLYGAPPPPRDR